MLDKYGKSFNLKNIDKLTAKTYHDFLLYKNNHHWKGLERNISKATSDMTKLKNTLKILVDESIPIEDRYEKIRTSKVSMGMATFTPILLVVTKMKYAVVNAKITNNDDNGALNKLGLINAKQSMKIGQNHKIYLS